MRETTQLKPLKTHHFYSLISLKAEAALSFSFYIKETMVNHKKMVHPPSLRL